MNRITTETSRIGKRGTVVIPVRLRRQFKLKDGDLMIAEAKNDGILLRPAVAVPVESYSSRRKAEFLLNNAVDAADYARAVREVRKLGLNPASVRHRRPTRK
jgi:AbrB family looped-hinge helix DNA binding protein